MRKTIPTLALASLLTAAVAAHAEETLCTGEIGAETLVNVFVPDGAMCVLTGTRAQGNIVVGTGSTLRATRISVIGNVLAEGASSVAIGGQSSIGGSVQAVQGGAFALGRSRINGDVLADSNDGPVQIVRNGIGGNLQAFQNTGGTLIALNVIREALQCKENTPAPTGGGNRAAIKQDQCEAL